MEGGVVHVLFDFGLWNHRSGIHTDFAGRLFERRAARGAVIVVPTALVVRTLQNHKYRRSSYDTQQLLINHFSDILSIRVTLSYPHYLFRKPL